MKHYRLNEKRRDIPISKMEINDKDNDKNIFPGSSIHHDRFRFYGTGSFF
jgi:hypothetical protein